MNKNILTYIYVSFICGVILIPVLTMNFHKEAISLIDNTYLPEFPAIIGNSDMPAEMDKYINKRIGLREETIFLYEAGIDKIFHELAAPGYTYGENGHIVGNGVNYTTDYQHLNLERDEEAIDAYAEWLGNVNQYLEDENIVFLYFLPTDKKTIYPECMPDTLNVCGEKSRTDMLLERIEDIPYIYPKQEFLEAKKHKQIYNVKYDVLHWNDFGAFLGHKLVDDYFQQECTGIVPLSEEQFYFAYDSNPHRLAASNFYVQEDIPTYSLIETECIEDITENDTYRENVEGEFEHYVNSELSDAPKILIFHDSYLATGAKYYMGRYREVISVHNKNYKKLQEYVEHYQPDIVLFENVERTLTRTFDDVSFLREWEPVEKQ